MMASATLQSLGALWPSAAAAAREAEPRGPAAPLIAVIGDGRVPVRNPDVRGPLSVYYYDHLTEVLGPDADVETALSRRDGGEVLTWEALNLVDGRRSVQEIRDVLTGRYAPVPLAEVTEYLDLLARAHVISWR